MHDTSEEAAALERLARAHKAMRDRRPAPLQPPLSDEETKAHLARILRTERFRPLGT